MEKWYKIHKLLGYSIANSCLELKECMANEIRTLASHVYKCFVR